MPIQDLGRRTGNAPVEVNFALRFNHQAELDQLVIAQQRRGSPMYRHWLTPEQFRERFSPTKEQETYVIAALEEAGFKITQMDYIQKGADLSDVARIACNLALVKGRHSRSRGPRCTTPLARGHTLEHRLGTRIGAAHLEVEKRLSLLTALGRSGASPHQSYDALDVQLTKPADEPELVRLD